VKVLIAPQSFKGGLSGAKAAWAIAEGLRKVFPNAQALLLPVADGGDGTLEALVESPGGKVFTLQVTGPLGDPVMAQWGAMRDEKTAVIEMALASGLGLVPPTRRDPRHTTTRGTGELIKEVLERGYRRLIVGLGGSATNDGGVGMAQALGIRFLDGAGRDLPQGGAALAKLTSIELSNRVSSLQGAEIIAATDVTNPLCGPQGASAVYGPQKGAPPKVVEELDRALAHYAKIIHDSLGVDVAHIPGAGAAGGLGAGLVAFAKARITSGIDLVCDVLGFDQHLAGANLVITGEGRLDASTIYNKAPIGVARRAKAHGIPVIALAGSLGEGYEAVYDHGIDAVAAITDRPMALRDSLGRTYELLVAATERSLRLLKLKIPP
jgi:glycerate kinase